MRSPLHLRVGYARWVLIPTPSEVPGQGGDDAVPSGDTNKLQSLSPLALMQDKVSSNFVRSTTALVVSGSSSQT